MADEPPQGPEPAAPVDPSVYGGRWGRGDDQDVHAPNAPDRPSPITTPEESPGVPPPANSPPIRD